MEKRATMKIFLVLALLLTLDACQNPGRFLAVLHYDQFLSRMSPGPTR